MSAVALLRFASKRPDWFDQAACRGANPGLWYPERGEIGGRGVKDNYATHVCIGCPARADCLELALDTHEHHGYWGGLSPRSREKHGRRVLAELRAVAA
jgi:WhiB family redox-sensing transcriptional regulator